MAVTFIASALKTGVTQVSTPAINTTGASLIVVMTAAYQGPNTFSDSAGNTWTALTLYNHPSTEATAQIFYCIAPTTSASHTFTQSATTYGTLFAMAFSGTGTFVSSSTGNSSGSNTVQPGAITTTAGQLAVLVSTASSGSGGWTVDSGLTITGNVNFVGGTNDAGMSAYLISGGGSIQPTSTYVGGFKMVSYMAVFNAAAQSSSRLAYLGAG